MRPNSSRFFAFAAACLCLALALRPASALAGVQLASPFTDHMVLQRELPVAIWGTAEAGTTITVKFGPQTKTAKTTAAGKWHVTLDPLAASAEGRKLVVSSSSGLGTVELQDVLVGEVWLASGQSNMDFTVAKTPKYYFAGVTNETEEVAAANYPLLRMFTGEWARSYQPQTNVGGQWKICSPDTVKEFSAIGYFFARDLQKELNVPIGIVTLTYGASTAQAWIRREAIAADPRLKPVLDEFDAKVKAYVPLSPSELTRWQAAVDSAKAAGKRAPRSLRPDPAQDQHNPTVMFNGMIAPVIGLTIRGVLWYQGESITGPRELFPVWNETLIKDWRKLWGRELPFYFCQLAGMKNNSNNPGVREMQTEALKLPKTGMAVTIDVGDPKNVHPQRKQEVGNRLMRIALANVYGRDVEYSGPAFQSSTIENGTLRLKFSHLGGGLVAHGGPLQDFEIAGSDQQFVTAEARVEGNYVIVSSPNVPTPMFARYAWVNYPESANFYNAAGLPAAPFRTDAGAK